MRESRWDLVDVMRHENHAAHARVVGDTAEERDQLFAPGEVEAGRRLIEDQQRRIAYQRAGEQHALPLAR